MVALTHELFEQQAARTPDAVAVVFGNETLTYGELNQRANQTAHYLRKRGVGPDILVGVCMERTPLLVTALLGVWKAGGAYVPLDPAYPQDRLEFMLGDANARVLITDRRSRRLFPLAEEGTVCLDLHAPLIGRESTGNPAPLATPSNLAYVMYTSGSTGKPKGAMIVHSGLTNYLAWAIEAYGVKAGGSVPVHSSISFDLTVTSLYPALLVGGQVELLPEDSGAQNLLAALRRQGGRTLVKITPAHLDLLRQQLRPEEAAGLTHCFVIGGENLLAESLRFWREHAPSTRLINEYGPTETVVGCCVYEVKPGDPHHGPVAIGSPIANTQLHVMDGELYIGGAGVARGYLNRPELTIERFVPDAFSGVPGARLYKTGDLARTRVDGSFEYLGRADNQVKVRGYRIELGEIEQVLAGHPCVGAAAVLAREDTPGNKQLVAYVTASRPGNAVALYEFLKERLPEYMVPTQIVFLDALPLTQNGKVDRNALPAPSGEDAAAGREFAAPCTSTERALAEIWRELLAIERIGIHEDVFDLGAHSLLAMMAVVQIRQAFALDVPLRSLFEYPTVAQLAELIDSLPWAAGKPSVQAGARREEITL
ncbi:MAG: amino acid adenylation domain-containing protein [Pseudomonadota bacterium]|nr:amino acid adenylation domain-containing protein [Pseudomonadota bacterium]